MKKILFFAAFAALLSVTSCQKEIVDNSSVESPIFTATIAGDSKTTINLNDGKIAWESNDEITVKDASSNSAIYVIESISETGRATFVIKSGETALGNGPYTATYGAAPAASQTYSETAGKLYMTAPETSTNSFTFTVACGLMKLNLTKANQSVKRIQVIGTPTEGSKTIYTLTFTEPKSIDSASDFYIALPAGTYTRIDLTNDSGLMCILKAKTALNIEINHIKPVTLPASTIDFNAISGVFSVSDTRKVYFSRGNLQAKYNDGTGYTWDFAANQYDYIGNTEGNTRINKQANDRVVDLFGWSVSATTPNFGINTSDSNYDGDFLDWGTTIDNKGTWSTLSQKELQYLFNTRTMTNDKPRYTLNITYGSKKGHVLYPDNYTGNTLISGTNYSTLPEGVVFLPAAGHREGSLVSMPNDAYYWTSTKHEKNPGYARLLLISGSDIYVNGYEGSRFGQSVRLVTDAN